MGRDSVWSAHLGAGVLHLRELRVLRVVLEFENGSREEEFLLFCMSQRGDFRMVGVACDSGT